MLYNKKGRISATYLYPYRLKILNKFLSDFVHLLRVKLSIYCRVVAFWQSPLTRLIFITLNVNSWVISIMLSIGVHFFNGSYCKITSMPSDN
ncbi:hypothetical protein KLPMMMO073B1_05270 [Klebsiella pneumoniae]|nr:hypothetical protein KP1VIM_03593 [Klebsiella pneumoniae]CEL83590.1 hypothetical protein BN1222_04888 [Klebsiella quasipneumoniae]CAG7578175.1 hypothetical protein KP1VIM_03593 [Klebsiella pneumoniae]SBY26776.1 Uncharacterised protein [Klebsiella pneumoniae]SXC82347.1 Uncharacterised protein [Klebsiella quasipneumoniae]